MNLPYPIAVGHGMLDRLPDILQKVSGANRIAIITDRNVGKRYATRVSKLVGRAPVFTIAPGEKHKTRQTWAMLTDKLLAAGFGRDTTILALGGGVVGDVAGFVAATYMRGIPVVQVPTTLLAMVDASVGGKTGVDTRAGKNLVGAFHRPSAVVIDLDVLGTLPMDHLRAGFAEVIKHGAIADESYFSTAANFAAHWPKPRAPLSDIQSLVMGSIRIKAEIVSHDERESGRRKILNFGHTIAHAVESATKFRVLHGYAVAIGMVAEARVAEALGVARPNTSAVLASVCEMAGLPTELPRVPITSILNHTRTDKKARAGKVEYALPKRIGEMAGSELSWTMPVEDTVVRRVLSNRV